jgi:hypothetical protein
MVVITEEQARAKEIDIETGRPPFTQKHSGEMNGLAALLVTAALSGRGRRRPHTAQYPLASPGALVPGCDVDRFDWGDAGLARNLRPACLATPSGGWP